MSLKKQFAILSGITILFVGPFLLLHGTNIVSNTYAFGAQRLWQGLTPFLPPEGGRDWYKYSPLFGFLYYPISLLQSRPQAFVWGVFNILLFWGGVCRVFRLGSSRWMWLAVIAASMELDGSSRYQQMNSFLAGLILFAIADFREKNYFRAGFLLAVATNIKLIPIVVLAPLCFPPKKTYLAGVAAGLLATFFLPGVFLGFANNVSLLAEWFQVLMKERDFAGILDIASGARQLGIPSPRLWVSLPVAMVSVAGLLAARSLKERGLGLTVALAILMLLLLSPRTESPTFVLVGISYLFLMEEALPEKGGWRIGLMAVWLVGFFFITFCQNDLWPRAIWNAGTWHLFNKTFGALILWGLSLVMVIRRLRA